ncbi:MFS transporter [Erysipelatoclostridium sp. An173]|uniref:MFS transporter n=1 Tax=Erysipelatoclostridium sp. An173 TaxID=1965571 RepID=UPI000B36986D|nr:MFS transporter [Erysipelatoclostridium sp. An173]OUP71242.1 MFS transporter [Erysipelatoclostridium sp. An173]
MDGLLKRVEKRSLLKCYKNSYLSYFLMYNFYYLSWALFSALISVYLMDRGFKASDVSLVVSASFLTSMITQPIIGKWNDEFDIKKVNAILFVIVAIGGIVFMVSNSLFMIAVSYSVVLMMINGVNPVMEKIATASPYQYGKIRIWGTIGYALGSQFAGILYDLVAPQAIFIVFVLTMILCIIGLVGTEPDIKKEAANENEKVKTMTLFKNKKFVYYLAICAIFYGVTNMSNTFVPSMLTDKGLDVDVTSTILSIAVFCEAPLVLFSNRFMDKIANKTLLIISISMVCLQCAVYGFDLPLIFILLIIFLAKHPSGMLYIMINLKVINTLIDENQQITALAYVATLKNLVAIIFQNVAGNILDVTTYSNLYLICFGWMLVALILVIFFKISSGNDKKLFN